MSGSFAIRVATPADREAIHAVEKAAFGQADEADLVDALVASASDLLELVAETDGGIVGHILFSRLMVERPGGIFPAVALAPLAVAPAMQRRGVGATLIAEGHRVLQNSGERLSLVLGDPLYYGRFGYTHGRAAGFSGDYQCEALQALAWGEAPATGRLAYAPAFSGL